MAKTVIILKGNKDRGKTSTLNYLVDMLKVIASDSCIYAPFFPEIDDQAVVIPIEGKRVGIVTLGDPDYEEQFRIWLDFCLCNQSDIIVVASRTQETLNGKITPYGVLWKEYINIERWSTIETSPYVIYEHDGLVDIDKLNKLCAESMFNMIQTLNF